MRITRKTDLSAVHQLNIRAQTPQRFNPTQAACWRSRLLAFALDEEGFHFLVLQNLHGRPLRSVALRDRKECLLRLRSHPAREVVLVDRVVLGWHGAVP